MFYNTDTNKNIAPKTVILILLSLFGVWQMGIMFFSGTSLSLYGKTPISFDETYTAIVIAAGYIVTIAMNYFFFEHSLFMGKITLLVSLTASTLMFFPFSSTVLTALFYLNAFCCTFLIGINYAIETALFDNKSELKFVFVNSLIVFTAIAFLQGDVITIPFWIFNIISVLIILTLLATYFLLPKRIESYRRSVKNTEAEITAKIRIPFVLKAGTYLIVFASTLCLVFGASISETVKYGTGLFYAVGIVSSAIFGFLVFKKNLSPYRIYTFSFVLIIVGFVFAALSTQFSQCIYLSVCFLGAACLPANTVGFLSNSLYKLKPSKAYAAVFLFIGLLVAGLHSILLNALKDNLLILFSVLSASAIIVLVLYVLIEANFTYTWGKTASKNASVGTDCETLSAETTINVNDEERKVIKPIAAQYDATTDALTEREAQIVDYILQGYGNEEIGKDLFLSPHTVKTHRKNIYIKLEIHSRRELFEWAKNNRLK